jgi:two-component system NtrC family sensor kinase
MQVPYPLRRHLAMSSSTGPEGPAIRPWSSLRAKALGVTLALLVYLGLSAIHVSTERAAIYRSVQALEQLSRHERALALLEAAIGSAVLDVQEASLAGAATAGVPSDIRLYMENCAKLFADLERFDSAYALMQRAIGRSFDGVSMQPVRANWIDLRETMARVHDNIEIRQGVLAHERDTQMAAYQRHYDTVTLQTLVLSGIGLLGFGSLAAWFFARLASDIRRLERHAQQVVSGVRGVTLEDGRGDELGQLMRSVNRMAVDLDEREKRLELELERRLHQDKMLTVGALAAGVAHEVNNPLAAIAGVVQDWKARPGPVPAPELQQGLALVLAQVERAAHAARHLAEVAAPVAADLDWIDLNAMVRRVAQLNSYDRRWRRLSVELRLDPQLPAVRTIGNVIQQVLMQMVSLACESITATDAAASSFVVETRAQATSVNVRMLLPPVIDFSRPQVQRALLMCRATVEPLRGRLAFGQAGDALMRIQLSLPIEGHESEG